MNKDTIVREDTTKYFNFGNTVDISKDFIREMKDDKEFTNMVCNRYLKVNPTKEEQKNFMKQIAEYVDLNIALKNFEYIVAASRNNNSFKAIYLNLSEALKYIKSLK